MTPYKIKVYEQLRTIYNKNLGYTPTKTLVIAMGNSYYKTYRALRELEDDGIIQRKSPHSGWRPSPLTAATYGILLRSYRRSHDFVSAQTVGVQLNTNDRIIRQEMVKLENAGIVTRSGHRGGWKPIRIQPEPTAVDKLLTTLHQLYDKSNQSVSTKSIAKALDVHPSHARRYLSKYHKQGIIQRAGYHTGWQPLSA
ncbi:hypothetical protein C8B47_10735 [filamentous cyanobacterium CCP4]|nr:hypothetical protein C8B47_10735 [filamentous cyanobacterium CCP4]